MVTLRIIEFVDFVHYAEFKITQHMRAETGPVPKIYQIGTKSKTHLHLKMSLRASDSKEQRSFILKKFCNYPGFGSMVWQILLQKHEVHGELI
jgi:hypothetical protein